MKHSIDYYRSKNRTVSTVSESCSPSPEPPPSAGYQTKNAPTISTHHLVAQNSTTSTSSSAGMNGVLDVVCASGNSLRSSFHRFLRSQRKNRTNSETVDCYRRTHSPDVSTDRECALPSLATEEVFEDSSSCCSESEGKSVPVPNSARSDYTKVRRRNVDGQTTVR